MQNRRIETTKTFNSQFNVKAAIVDGKLEKKVTQVVKCYLLSQGSFAKKIYAMSAELTQARLSLCETNYIFMVCFTSGRFFFSH